jgi:hypothetical protein
MKWWRWWTRRKKTTIAVELTLLQIYQIQQALFILSNKIQEDSRNGNAPSYAGLLGPFRGMESKLRSILEGVKW